LRIWRGCRGGGPGGGRDRRYFSKLTEVKEDESVRRRRSLSIALTQMLD
jgi:hypothetical protein